MIWSGLWGSLWGDPLLGFGAGVEIGLFTSLATLTESSIGRRAYTGAWYLDSGYLSNTTEVNFTAFEHETVDGWGLWNADGLILAYPFERAIWRLYPDSTLSFEPSGIGVGEATLTPRIRTSLTHPDATILFHQLLPDGPVWEGPTLNKLVTGVAREFSRLDNEVAAVLDEMIPSRTADLVRRWEEAVGLPDECTGDVLPTTLEERRAAIQARLSERSSATPTRITQIAEDLGYTGVTITRSLGNPFVAGSAAGDSLEGGLMHMAFELSTDQSTPDDTLLQCRVDRIAPAFSYPVYSLG